MHWILRRAAAILAAASVLGLSRPLPAQSPPTPTDAGPTLPSGLPGAPGQPHPAVAPPSARVVEKVDLMAVPPPLPSGWSRPATPVRKTTKAQPSPIRPTGLLLRFIGKGQPTVVPAVQPAGTGQAVPPVPVTHVEPTTAVREVAPEMPLIAVPANPERVRQLILNACGTYLLDLEIQVQRDNSLRVRAVVGSAGAAREVAERALELPEMKLRGVTFEVQVGR